MKAPSRGTDLALPRKRRKWEEGFITPGQSTNNRKQQKEKMKSCIWPGGGKRKEMGLNLLYCKYDLEITAVKTRRHCHSFSPEEEYKNYGASLPNLGKAAWTFTHNAPAAAHSPFQPHFPFISHSSSSQSSALRLCVQKQLQT